MSPKQPPLGTAWYGPKEIIWSIPHPFLPDQRYRLPLSTIRRAMESDDPQRCFLAIDKVPELLLVGAPARWFHEHAPWTKPLQRK